MDIDIDFPKSFNADEVFDITHASIVENNKNFKKHNVGVYFQNIPKDVVTGLSSIPYKDAEKNGYLKIDFLPLSFLDNFDNKSEIRKLLKYPPDWTLLDKKKNIKKLFHISNHVDVVKRVKPKSISDLSDILALIRPNKIKLLDKYIKNKNSVKDELYKKRHPSDMRKSHTVPYAMIIVLQMHLLKAGVNF